ncbi:vesicle-associated membrane protein 7-like [Halichondria panicea]|uniref:vesicle-associated membrane protein 7-like n=1 Tax=Halichondria panicea TaxID=6063 RepID=UPI00312B93B1
MPQLYYALVARQRVILCDYTLRQGPYESSALSALDKAIADRVSKISYEDGNVVFHVLVSQGLAYLCASDLAFDRSLAFGCLQELENRLYRSPGLKDRAEYVGPYALRGEFSVDMSQVLTQYGSGDKLGKLQTHVTAVKGVMKDNLDKVVLRGETLDDLEGRSEQLANSSTNFRHSAVKLRRKELCRRNKWCCCVSSVVFIVLFLIILGIVLGILKGTNVI